MNTKEFSPAMIENMTAIFSPDEYGLKLEIIDEKKRRAGNPSLDYEWKGHWTITKYEAVQIIEFMSKPFHPFHPENPDPTSWMEIEAEDSYYLDVPGEPRTHVGITRFGDGRAEFGIGDNYKYRFPKEQTQEVLSMLKEYHGL